MEILKKVSSEVYYNKDLSHNYLKNKVGKAAAQFNLNLNTSTTENDLTVIAELY